MSKTKEELNELKEEVETLDEKLHELTEEELAQVVGGKSGPPSAAFINTVTLISSDPTLLKPYDGIIPIR